MLQKMYCIRDSKSDIFLSPFVCATNGAAMRSFHDITNESTSVIAKHPEDYGLYFIGEFDQDAGVFVPQAVPIFLESALNMVVNA